jgi:hypothetical protein
MMDIKNTLESAFLAFNIDFNILNIIFNNSNKYYDNYDINDDYDINILNNKIMVIIDLINCDEYYINNQLDISDNTLLKILKILKTKY